MEHVTDNKQITTKTTLNISVIAFHRQMMDDMRYELGPYILRKL